MAVPGFPLREGEGLLCESGRGVNAPSLPRSAGAELSPLDPAFWLLELGP
jgi:hypothetical protein